MSRAEWLRACRIARTGGAIRTTKGNLRAAYLVANSRYPFEDIEGLALQ